MTTTTKTDKVPVIAYSAEIDPAPGIDPARYCVAVLVDRRDGKPLSAAELATLERVYPQRGRSRTKATPKRAAARRKSG